MVPKFIIPVEQLGPPNENGDQLFRFRVLSQDRNRVSPYSTLFIIESTGQIYPLKSVSRYNVSSSVINVYWDTPSIYNTGSAALGASVLHNHESEWKVHDSDIFISWDGSPFEYVGRSRDNSFSIVVQQSATTARVIGQVANYPPKKLSIFEIFDTGTITL